MENQKLSINVGVNEWNVVMQALGNMPYAQVAGLVEEIRQQAQGQLNNAPANSDAVVDSAAA